MRESDTHCPTLGTGASEDRDPDVIEDELLDGPTHSCEPDTVETLPVKQRPSPSPQLTATQRSSATPPPAKQAIRIGTAASSLLEGRKPGPGG